MAVGSPVGGSLKPDEFRRLLSASASTLGRFQAPELFHSQTVDLSAPVTVQIPRPLNINRPLESISIVLKCRVAVTAANYTAVAPEAPQNLLQEVQLTGIHRAYGNLTPIRMSGATAYMFPFLFQRRPNWIIINNTVAAEPSIPLSSPFAGTTAGSPYDMILTWNIPFAPQMGIDQNLKRQASSFLYLPQDWTDSLYLTLKWGDKSALGDPTGATVAFTSYGAGTGTPTMELHLNYAILGPFANNVQTGVCVRNEQSLTTFTALASRTRLMTLQKQITPNILVRTGVAQTAGLTAGVSTLASVSDLQLESTQLVVDNKAVRNGSSNMLQKGYVGRMFGTVVPQGYMVLTFVDGQNALLAYRGDGLSGGSSFELVSDVISANANNRQYVTQEMIIGGPFPALR